MNICYLNDLLVSNRQRLYEDACAAMLKQLYEAPAPQQDTPTMLPFEVVDIAGDGRCGWRAILASLDIAAFKSVPRTVVLKGM